MKKSLLVAALFAAFSSTSAMAADTATVNATATVLANCQFVQDQGILNFGEINVTQGGALASTQLTYQCTRGTQSTLVLNNGVPVSTLRNQDGSSTIGYILTIDPDDESRIGEGFSGPVITYPISAFIPGANFKNAKPGTHADTIFVTLTE